MYDLLTELALPWFKSLFPAPEQAPSQTKDGWLLEPSEEDAALSLTGSVDKAHESLIGRLIELGPKVFLLCYVHSYAVMTSAQVIAAALAECGVFGRLSSMAVLAYSVWISLYLGSGVLENVARRHFWLRLCENGLLLQPMPQGTSGDQLKDSWEYRLLCGGLVSMGFGLYAFGHSDLVPSLIASSSSLLILHKTWILTWRLPSAPDFLCGRTGVLDTDLVRQLQAVSEREVASACAALPLDAPSSFGALAALIRSRGTVGTTAGPAKEPPVSQAPKSEDVSLWAIERHWAMRFLGIAPPLSLILSLLHGHAALQSLGLAQLPVRCGAGFKAAKDREFASRLTIWNGVFITTVSVVHLWLWTR